MRLTVLDDDPGRKINLGVERYEVVNKNWPPR